MAFLNTAIILAGGESSRMGFDKQLINMEGVCITDHIIQSLKPLFKNIIIVTSRPELYKEKNLIITKDIFKGYGPLGGIHAGLTKSSSMYNYFIACDMPYINTDYIKYMMDKIVKDNYKTDAVITKFGQWIEPFNAFYSRRLIKNIEKNILSDKRRISELLDESNVLYIEEEIARKYSIDWSMFTNLNTEKDLKNLGLSKKRRIII